MAKRTTPTRQNNVNNVWQHDRDPGEYPFAVQRFEAPDYAMMVYDRLHSDLMNDGYSDGNADMLLDINMDQVLSEAAHDLAEAKKAQAASQAKDNG